jgi:pimeloyl-ACP methyl ester carboxylesterase
MKVIKNLLLSDQHGKPIATDIFFESDNRPKPVVIYAHGFNGFKDWGNFDLIARQFAAAGYVFIKFNFSFNGTTPEQPEDFVNLDAFGRNNYSIELDNLGAVIDWATEAGNPYAAQIDATSISLIGHSLGGGIVLLKAAADSRVTSVITWAAVSACKTPWGNWPPERINTWRETGVAYIANGRTGQQMPLYFQLYEDFQLYPEALDIEQAVKKLQIPLLICHGLSDPAVPVQSAYQIQSWKPDAVLFTPDSDHVFGRKHPWTEENLPIAMQQVVDESIHFLNAMP